MAVKPLEGGGGEREERGGGRVERSKAGEDSGMHHMFMHHACHVDTGKAPTHCLWLLGATRQELT